METEVNHANTDRFV